jgi:hypothetical protein
MPRASTLAVASCGAAAAASFALLVLPVYGTSDSDGVEHGATLIAVNGAWVLIWLVLPVAVAALPLVVRRRVALRTAAVLVLGFALIAGFSIGGFYLPAGLLLMLAATRPAGAT